MSKHQKQIRLNISAASAANAALGARAAEAENIAQESLAAGAEGAQVLANTSRLRSMGFHDLATYIEEASARAILRGGTTTLAFASFRDGFGPGLFDEIEDYKKGNEYQILEPQVPVFRSLLRRYAQGKVVLVRPGTPFFEEGAWIPEPDDPSGGPVVPRPGYPMRISEKNLIGGGWVWVRPRPGGGVQAVRFPFHRAAINGVKEVPGAVFSHKTREWQMEGDADASILLQMLQQVFDLKKWPSGDAPSATQ